MLSVEDWAEIRRLYHAEGLPIRVIARVLRISRNTVKAALASDHPPKYQRPQRGSIVDDPTAVRAASAQLASQHESPWRSPTSITFAGSNATPSPIWR